MKAKPLFLTDLLLLITFVPSSVTGFILHWAGHQNSHELWHNWAVAHIISILFLTTLVAIHIYGHWGWYKSLLKNGIKNKSRVTVVLSALMLGVAGTGIVVLFRHKWPNTGLGLWHYVLGIIITAVVLGHFIKRHRILIKGLKANRKK
ncbi:MAG: DUF4405 domain-containing protein [Alistipes sp.]|nr:DUF4405 domain-containing protein [Alistipes sp.]